MVGTKREIRWSVVAVAALCVVACMAIALRRIRVESDLTNSIPAGTPVLESGRRLLAKHPLIDWVAIDISSSDAAADTARLVEAAAVVQSTLQASKQFESIGSGDWIEGIAALHSDLVQRLPTLFSFAELETQVAPRLTDEGIRSKLQENIAKLGELDGVGQAADIAADPLGLRELIYARLGALVPQTSARVEGNHLVSADGKHLLLTAVPHHALGDPESSRRIADVLDDAQRRLDARSTETHAPKIVLVPTGAYRAAIDNEAIVKADTNRAVWLVTVAVSLLLLTCFSRPVLGLLTLLPASAGVAIALLLYSFYRPSMSALSLGFGAALISITVDQGIVYIAYLDRVRGATGRSAAKQTFSAVSLATLTTVGAFFALKFSGYRLLEELGIFAALGSAFSFGFVHTIFPLVFRAAAPAERRPVIPIDRWLAWLSTGSVRWRVAIAMAIAIGLGSFARPRFEVDLNRLNTVTTETRAAEEHVRSVWGDLMSRAYVLLEARDPIAIQDRSDALAQLLARERASKITFSEFTPSQLWPGPRLSAEHSSDWRRFWDEPRRERVKRSISAAASELGFSSDAFDGFLQSLSAPPRAHRPIPREAYSLLGIAKARDDSGWVWLGSIERGPAYDPARFAADATAAGFSVFDGNYFGRGLNAFLGTAFARMLLIVAPFVLLAVGLSFQNLRLVLLVLFPVVLALVATLGTFGLMGRPIDIPGLMIAVVVLGMGTNFSVYLVHAHQRYPDARHPVHDSVRVAALLDGGATVLGMGVMAASAHAAARSAGLSGLFGIGFSLFGALVLLPPILQRTARIGGPWPADGQASPKELVWSRFRYLEPAPVWAARRKLAHPQALEALAGFFGEARRLAVVGCGYGVETAWLLAKNPKLRVSATEADLDRCQIAQIVLGDRGDVCAATDAALEHCTAPADAVLVLDAGAFEANGLAIGVGGLVTSSSLVTAIAYTASLAQSDALARVLTDAGFTRRDAAVGIPWATWQRSPVAIS